MSYTLDDFKDEIEEQLGGDLLNLVDDGWIERVLNVARVKVGARDEKYVDITWAAGATKVDLPADLVVFDRIEVDESVTLPGHRIWGQELRFLAPQGAESAGSGTVFYLTHYAVIDSTTVTSTMPEQAQLGLVSYCLYRFYHKLAGGRADYRRYATLTGANGVGVDDLRELANEHLDDFRDAVLSVNLPPPETYFGD